MKDDSDEDSFSSLLTTADGEVKTDTKTEKDISNMHEISGNSKDVHECSEACSIVLDISLVSSAFQYYKYIKEKNLPWDAFSSPRNPLDAPSSCNPLDPSTPSSNPLDPSTLSSNPLDSAISSSNPLDSAISSSNPLDPSIPSCNIWDNSDTSIKETDGTQPSDSTTDLEKTLSDLQMDSDLMSEWPKLNTDFLNLYNFFDEQLESNNSLSNQFTIHETEVPDQAVATFETGHSDSKSLCNDSSESIQPETDYESLETRSAASKSSLSWSQQSENTGDGRSALKHFHVGGYFPEELDYEPSEAGETEAKESDSEFCFDNSVKEEESGSFPHYCSRAEVHENCAFQKRIEETGAEEQAEPKQDFISFFESNFESGTDKGNVGNNYNGHLEYADEDEDSESDSEHSFKRNSSRIRQFNDLESLHPISVNSDVSMISQLNTINEVMLYIGEQCKCGNVNEAIAVANRYISNSVEAVKLEIFKELFINVIDLIKSPFFPVGDMRISKSLGDVMDLFQQSKLLDSDLCSLVVSECFGCDHAIETGKEFLSLIQKIKVPINSTAVSSYVDTVIPSEIPSLDLISFLEYVKFVCNLSCPKTLLCEALERFSKQEEGSLPFGFFRLCKFLCSVNSKEVDLNHLQNFIKFCLKNDSWMQISSFFRAWCSTDGHLIGCLQGSFLFRPEDAGLFYEKLADEIYENGDISLYLVGILGQFGVCLMLEVFSRKLYDSAFDVLFTLHRRNINYLELQAALLNPPSYLKSLPNFAEMFVFPFTVAFAALDICLHLERFKDAYRVFKSFSLQLPADMDGKLKLNIRSRRFRYLLRLAQELFRIDPLKLGLQAFHDISSVAEDFSLKELEDFAEEIQAIYNKYLTYAVNECQLHTALELFECSEGALKEVFVIRPQVLRGLLVIFAQNNKLDEAWKFFALGYVRKMYNTEQIETEEFVCHLSVISSWTVFEVEFAIKNFIKNICLAWHGKYKNEIHMQPSVKIVFKESEEACSEMDCLKKPCSIDSSRDATCSVLKSLDSNIKWIENRNPVSLELVFKTVHNYWMNTAPINSYQTKSTTTHWHRNRLF